MTAIRTPILAVVLAACAIPAAARETTDDQKATRDNWQEASNLWKNVDSEAILENYRVWKTRCAWDRAWREWTDVECLDHHPTASSGEANPLIRIDGGSVEIRRSHKETHIRIEGGKTEIILK